MIGFCPLASGSKGNALYLGTKEAKILIDVGISKRMLEKRLQTIGVDMASIDAIIVTHEHHDHIYGLSGVCKTKKIPIFANRLTAQELCKQLTLPVKFKIFTNTEPFSFKDIRIQPFSIQHDTLDPVGLTIETEKMKIGICTDLGYATSMVKKHLANCDYLYIEANHQPSMVHACNRPQVYKQRVLSRQGHLSNEACAQLLSSVYHPNLKKVYLAHLSSECNNPDVAIKVVQEHLAQNNQSVKEICIAYQDKVSAPVLFEERI